MRHADHMSRRQYIDIDLSTFSFEEVQTYILQLPLKEIQEILNYQPSNSYKYRLTASPFFSEATLQKDRLHRTLKAYIHKEIQILRETGATSTCGPIFKNSVTHPHVQFVPTQTNDFGTRIFAVGIPPTTIVLPTTTDSHCFCC